MSHNLDPQEECLSLHYGEIQQDSVPHYKFSIITWYGSYNSNQSGNVHWDLYVELGYQFTHCDLVMPQGDINLPWNLQYKMYQITKLKCFSARLPIVFAQYIEAKF